jgi:hypothetical protein
MMENKVTDFLKNNWVTLTTWVVLAAAAIGVHTVNMRWVDDRLNRLERVNIQQIQWQVELHSKAIERHSDSEKAIQRDILSIQIQIGKLDTKLDTIVEAVKDLKPNKQTAFNAESN